MPEASTRNRPEPVCQMRIGWRSSRRTLIVLGRTTLTSAERTEGSVSRRPARSSVRRVTRFVPSVTPSWAWTSPGLVQVAPDRSTWWKAKTGEAPTP